MGSGDAREAEGVGKRGNCVDKARRDRTLQEHARNKLSAREIAANHKAPGVTDNAVKGIRQWAREEGPANKRGQEPKVVGLEAANVVSLLIEEGPFRSARHICATAGMSRGGASRVIENQLQKKSVAKRVAHLAQPWPPEDRLSLCAKRLADRQINWAAARSQN